MSDMYPKSMPLPEAYAFAAEHGLGAQASQIQNLAIDPRRFKKSATVRHGYLQKLFEEHGLLDAFMDRYWPFGQTPEGRAKRNVYSRVWQEHQGLGGAMQEGEVDMDAVDPENDSLMEQLSAHLQTREGLVFRPERLAQYLTALQTKGFVILGGISGTGKTRLAQASAELLRDDEANNYLFVSVRPDWRDNRSLLGYYNPLTERYESTELLRFILESQAEVAPPSSAAPAAWLEIRFRSVDVQEWLGGFAAARARLQGKAPEQMDEEDLTQLWRLPSNGVAGIGRAGALHVTRPALLEATRLAMNSALSVGERYIKVVQVLQEGAEPDDRGGRHWARAWRAIAAFTPGAAHTIVHGSRVRDLLRQLGYPTPADPRRLAERGDAMAVTEATAFLLAEAKKARPQGSELELSIAPWLLYEYYFQREVRPEEPRASATPFFLVLDGMNLARVEHYFADFLSVLEGGRRPDGFTRESIRLHQFSRAVVDADKEPIPPEIRLPPNLYIVGTVNVDDSTHGFSPKVLDRAFALEFDAPALESYPPEITPGVLLPDAARQALLSTFTRAGRFCHIDKAAIRTFHKQEPAYMQRLTALATSLRPHELDFGYRVVDEILMFLANALESQWFSGVGGVPTAFDLAVLMKVLPKFHGSRLRLEDPLWTVMGWAGAPVECHEAFMATVDKSLGQASVKLDEALRGAQLPNTARKCGRMLRNLYATGYASFS